MIVEIKSRWDSKVLFSVEAGSLKLALEIGITQGADLRGADLRGADLEGADLEGADLGGADLRGADLNFLSHDFVAEILRRAAGDDVEKLKIAGLVLVKRNWCWKEFLELRDPLQAWALGELKKWVTDKTPDKIKNILGTEAGSP